jgi:hypothetical protein
MPPVLGIYEVVVRSFLPQYGIYIVWLWETRCEVQPSRSGPKFESFCFTLIGNFDRDLRISRGSVEVIATRFKLVKTYVEVVLVEPLVHIRGQTHCRTSVELF